MRPRDVILEKIQNPSIEVVSTNFGLVFGSIWGEPINSFVVGADYYVIEFEKGLRIMFLNKYEDMSYVNALYKNQLSESTLNLLRFNNYNFSIEELKDIIYSSTAYDVLFSFGNRQELNIDLIYLKHISSFPESNRGIHRLIASDKIIGFQHGRAGDQRIVLELLLEDKFCRVYLFGGFSQQDIDGFVISIGNEY